MLRYLGRWFIGLFMLLYGVLIMFGVVIRTVGFVMFQDFGVSTILSFDLRECFLKNL